MKTLTVLLAGLSLVMGSGMATAASVSAGISDLVLSPQHPSGSLIASITAVGNGGRLRRLGLGVLQYADTQRVLPPVTVTGGFAETTPQPFVFQGLAYDFTPTLTDDLTGAGDFIGVEAVSTLLSGGVDVVAGAGLMRIDVTLGPGWEPGVYGARITFLELYDENDERFTIDALTAGTVTVVPEPGAALLASAGGFWLWRRRRPRQAPPARRAGRGG